MLESHHIIPGHTRSNHKTIKTRTRATPVCGDKALDGLFHLAALLNIADLVQPVQYDQAAARVQPPAQQGKQPRQSFALRVELQVIEHAQFSGARLSFLQLDSILADEQKQRQGSLVARCQRVAQRGIVDAQAEPREVQRQTGHEGAFAHAGIALYHRRRFAPVQLTPEPGDIEFIAPSYDFFPCALFAQQDTLHILAQQSLLQAFAVVYSLIFREGVISQMPFGEELHGDKYFVEQHVGREHGKEIGRDAHQLELFRLLYHDLQIAALQFAFVNNRL